jgi:hypothetical protein
MTTTRRSFLRLAGLAATAALTVPRSAAAGPGSSALQRFSSSVQPRTVMRHGALAVVWLHGGEPGAGPSIATLDEAQTSGALLITERGSATVPELIVDNRGKAHVLLLAGEILVGGKQNRVLREDILLPPLSGPRSLSVYCVEQGRWSGGRKEFESKAYVAQPSLRRKLLDKEEQGRVWAEVDRSVRAQGLSPAPSGSLALAYEAPEVRRRLDDVERAVDERAAPGAVGAMVVIGQEIAALDAFRVRTCSRASGASSSAPMPSRRTGARRRPARRTTSCASVREACWRWRVRQAARPEGMPEWVSSSSSARPISGVQPSITRAAWCTWR